MSFDRRHIFVLMALAVMLPLLMPLGLPITITNETRAVYEVIESLDSNSVVMISFDHEASSLPEVRPLAEVVLAHCFDKKVGVIGLALFAEGTAIGYDVIKDVADRYQLTNGRDYVYLGYRPQYSAAILGMGEAIAEVFPADYDGTPLAALPLLNGVRNYQDIDLVISVADGSLPTYWVEYAQARYQQRIIAALAAVMVTAYTPYVEAGQIDGLLGGLKGAAEYEKLLDQPAAGTRGMDAQSMAHLTVALLIVLGNFVALVSRRRKPSPAEPGRAS